MERARHLCLCSLPPAQAMVHDLEQPFSPRLLCSHAASGLAQQARRPPAYNHGSNGIPRISAAISGRVNGVDNMLHSLSDRMRTSRCGHLLDRRTALVSLGMRRPIRPPCCRYNICAFYPLKTGSSPPQRLIEHLMMAAARGCRGRPASAAAPAVAAASAARLAARRYRNWRASRRRSRSSGWPLCAPRAASG